MLLRPTSLLTVLVVPDSVWVFQAGPMLGISRLPGGQFKFRSTDSRNEVVQCSTLSSCNSGTHVTNRVVVHEPGAFTNKLSTSHDASAFLFRVGKHGAVLRASPVFFRRLKRPLSLSQPNVYRRHHTSSQSGFHVLSQVGNLLKYVITNYYKFSFFRFPVYVRDVCT
jgi:hypothetical protein